MSRSSPIIDLSKVWVELDVFQSELASVEAGQAVELKDLEGKKSPSGASVALHRSRCTEARAFAHA